MNKDHCGQNRRSRDVPRKERDDLIARAAEILEATPALLKTAGIPLDGNGTVAFPPPGKQVGGKLPSIQIEPVTTQTLAARATSKSCVFIACSHSKPGGGWLSGAVAQEESVSRDSTWAVQCANNPTWHKSSKDWMGPRGALVVDGLLLLGEPPRQVVFAGIAAANKNACPRVQDWEVFRNARIDALASAVCGALREAEHRECGEAILCAAGTGVFGWPPDEALVALATGVRNSRFQGIVKLAAGNPDSAARLTEAAPW
jgi:hypothetical protein